MDFLRYEAEIVDTAQKSLKEGEKLTVRRQQCTGCKVVLAMQLSMNKLNEQSAAEYFVVKQAIKLKGEILLLYKQERWFGNYLRCPVCGREGNLPMDKPLNWENMEGKENLNLKQEVINA